VEGIEADEARCAASVHSSSAAALALLPRIGAEAARAAVTEARARSTTIRDVVVADGTLTAAEYDELLSPEAVGRLGTEQHLGRGVED
jgi:aspartate ammonia-lyase